MWRRQQKWKQKSSWTALHQHSVCGNETSLNLLWEKTTIIRCAFHSVLVVVCLWETESWKLVGFWSNVFKARLQEQLWPLFSVQMMMMMMMHRHICFPNGISFELGYSTEKQRRWLSNKPSERWKNGSPDGPSSLCVRCFGFWHLQEVVETDASVWRCKGLKGNNRCMQQDYYLCSPSAWKWPDGPQHWWCSPESSRIEFKFLSSCLKTALRLKT